MFDSVKGWTSALGLSLIYVFRGAWGADQLFGVLPWVSNAKRWLCKPQRTDNGTVA